MEVMVYYIWIRENRHSDQCDLWEGGRKMDIIKDDAFRRLVKKGLDGGSGFLFFGDEDYLKLHELNRARESVCSDEGFAFFNDMRIDALDFSPSALLDAMMPLPMMSDKKMVSVSGLDLSSIKTSELDALCEVLEALSEYDYNVLIISVVAGGIDEGYLPRRPSAILSKLSKYLTPVRFETVTPARLLAWCQRHFEHNGVRCDDDVCRAMIERCGSSMFILSSEIDKLSFYAREHGRERVEMPDVANICCTTVEADAFALTNAVLDGKNERALGALAVMKYNRVEPVALLSEISRVICDLVTVKSMLSDGKTSSEIAMAMKMNEYKVRLYVSGASSKSTERLRRALSLCVDADAAIKLSAGGYDELENLLCTI